MKLFISFLLGLFLLLDFWANAWVSLGGQKDSRLDIKEVKSLRTVSVKPLDYIAHKAFGVTQPIFIEAEALLASQDTEVSEVNVENEIYEIRIEDYVLKLLGIVSKEAVGTAIISYQKLGESPQILKVTLGKKLASNFIVTEISQKYVALKPIVNEQQVAKFGVIRLHIFKPKTKQEVL